MSKSHEMRELARQGLSTAEIAKRLGVRYQTVRGALVRSGQHVTSANMISRSPRSKPTLTTDFLYRHGFARRASWRLTAETAIQIDTVLSNEPGVYAFVIDGIVQYVGLASRSVAKRLYFYARPAATQRTNIRLNSKIGELLKAGTLVDVLVAHPTDSEWNGLRISGAQGLEAALIADYDLPWNRRGG